MNAKKAYFLSYKNQQYLIKRFYIKHLNDGGTLTLDTFEEQIPSLMRNWNVLNQIDTYESLLYKDPLVEMEAINNDFMRIYWPSFSVGDDYKTITKLETPNDYHILSTTTNKDVTVQNDTYRFNNTFPLYQKIPDRHYDRDDNGSGLRGRTLEQNVYSIGDMDELLANTNLPYRKIDDNDKPYFGKQTDDSSTSLTTTIWASS